MIEARNLTKRYGDTTAVDDLTFKVRPGIVTGFLGPNGSGKSTTMRMILGLDRPSSGHALVNGRPYVDSPAPLAEIGALLDRPGTDRLTLLAEQRDRLAAQAEHFAGLVRTIDRTIADLKGDVAMDDKDLYAGVVSPEKQAEHERWLENRYGEGIWERIDAGRKAWGKMAPAEIKTMMAELEQVESGLAEAMRSGVAADSLKLGPLLERHRRWVQLSWGDKPVTAAVYSGLADLYVSHPDFVSRYDRIAPGFAAYLHDAMQAQSARLLA